MPHFVSPGQWRVRRAVHSLSAVLDRFCDAYAGDGRLREELALSSREDALIRLDLGLLAAAANLPAGRVSHRLRGQVPGVQRRLARRHRLHRRARGGAATGHRASPRELRVRDGLHADAAAAHRDLTGAYRELRAEPRRDLPETPRLALVDVAGSPSVPEFRIVRAAAEGRRRGDLGHARGRGLRRLPAARARPAGAPGLPSGAARGAARGRPGGGGLDRRAAVVNPFRARCTTRSCSRCSATSASPTS